MKKKLSVLLIATMIHTVTACSSNEEPKASNTPAASNPATSETPDASKPATSETPVASEPATSETPDDTDPAGNDVLKKSPEEIIAYLYENAKETETLKGIEEWAEIQEVTAERTAWFLGKEGIIFEKAVASESPMSPSSYSLVVVKVKEGDDVEAVKKTIQDNLQPNKWICMGGEDKIVESIDNVILAVIADKATLASLKDTFLALK